MQAKPSTYAASGVSIDKGDDFARYIAGIKSPVIGSIGGFAGGLELDTTKYKKPVILTTTDGVGTKLLVGKRLGKIDTLGIDLVAMCVNDLIVCGAEPLLFLDYIACGKVEDKLLKSIIHGIVKGCEQAECTLAGGETAEMPDLYAHDDFDLAGFCTGVVDKDKMLPKKSDMKAGDPVFGLASSGVHSNGYSLARKVLEGEAASVWEELLTPTIIYVKALKHLLAPGIVTGAAHITGGGLEGNFERVVPQHLKAHFSWDWAYASIFDRIQKLGNVETAEMRRVFNMGIGIALTCPAEKSAELKSHALKGGIELIPMGELRHG